MVRAEHVALAWRDNRGRSSRACATRLIVRGTRKSLVPHSLLCVSVMGPHVLRRGAQLVHATGVRGRNLPARMFNDDGPER